MDRHIIPTKLDAFLREFTEKHREQPVTLELFLADVPNVAESGLPLVGLDLEMQGRDAPVLEIILGETGDDELRHLTHTVRGVTRVTLELDENDEAERLIIEDADGPEAILQIG